MNHHEINQKDLWPRLIILGLIITAIILSWMAAEAVQRTSLESNYIRTVSETMPAPTSEIHPADRKFFVDGEPGPSVKTSLTEIKQTLHPADRKFLNGWYPSAGEPTP